MLLAHEVREQLIKQRTQTVNALRSHLAESGVVYPKGIQHVSRICELIRLRQVPEVPRYAYGLLVMLVDHIEELDKAIKTVNLEFRSISSQMTGQQRGQLWRHHYCGQVMRSV